MVCGILDVGFSVIGVLEPLYSGLLCSTLQCSLEFGLHSLKAGDQAAKPAIGDDDDRLAVVEAFEVAFDNRMGCILEFLPANRAAVAVVDRDGTPLFLTADL